MAEEVKIDVNRFLNETTLPASLVAQIRYKQEKLKHRKGVYSQNDTLGKEIASAVFGDLASAHFRRWILANYEIGDEE